MHTNTRFRKGAKCDNGKEIGTKSEADSIAVETKGILIRKGPTRSWRGGNTRARVDLVSSQLRNVPTEHRTKYQWQNADQTDDQSLNRE